MSRTMVAESARDAVANDGEAAAAGAGGAWAGGEGCASDAVLVGAVVRGDEAAFRALYRRHTPRLYQVVLRLLGGVEQDAEDVVQETWVRAVAAVDRFRWDSSFGTWLTGIGLNRARDLMRRAGRRPVWEGDPERILSEVRAAAVLHGDRIDLERAIALLPDGYRTVFVLHDLEGYPHAAIAERLEISEGTSKSQLFHARRTLRALLNGGNHDG